MRRRIIIADDTAYMRAIIRQTLTDAGLTVVAEAETGEDAFTMFCQHRPDLIILNLVMPRLEGLETLKKIKEINPEAKVLICSAMGQANIIFRAVQAGANDFLAKPFNAKQLLEAAGRTLRVQLYQTPVEEF
jgi:two-component system, chemotaxis family, chemotaxis protein CheY